MELIDSSAWVEYVRSTGSSAHLEVRRLLRADYRDAAAIYRTVRRGGRAVRTLFDCLIASVAVRTGATVVHRDRDFDVVASRLPDLRVRSFA